MSQALRCPSLHALAAVVAILCAGATGAQDFNWKKHQGKTLTFLANNNPANNTPVANALLKYQGEFEQQTGMTLKVDAYQEQQMRQRLVTVMNARSDEVDVFMSLPSREGLQFAKAGWYADLAELLKSECAKDYDATGLSAGMIRDATYGKQLTGIPMNVEGPVLYYRKDLLRKCGLALPESLTGLEAVAAKLKR